MTARFSKVSTDMFGFIANHCRGIKKCIKHHDSQIKAWSKLENFSRALTRFTYSAELSVYIRQKRIKLSETKKASCYFIRHT